MSSVKLVTKNWTTIVDVEDFCLINCINWELVRGGYLRGPTKKKLKKKNNKFKRVLLHRLILNPNGKQQIDHINGDKLDNRKSNLRICTNSENCRNKKMPINKSGFRGAYFQKGHHRNKPWMSSINIYDYVKCCLGYFKTAEEAHAVYVEASLAWFGEFSYYSRPQFKKKVV